MLTVNVNTLKVGFQYLTMTRLDPENLHNFDEAAVVARQANIHLPAGARLYSAKLGPIVNTKADGGPTYYRYYYGFTVMVSNAQLKPGAIYTLADEISRIFVGGEVFLSTKKTGISISISLPVELKDELPAVAEMVLKMFSDAGIPYLRA